MRERRAPARPASAAPAKPEQVLEDAGRLEHLRQQQLKLLCSQATRAPYAVAVGAMMVAYTVWPHVKPAWLIMVWVLALYIIPFARRAYAKRLLEAPPAAAQEALNAHLGFMVASGIATGMAGPLFFPQLPLERQALLTMILVCWTAGGVSTTAAYARAFHVYVWPVLGPLSVVWGLTGTPEHIVVAVLIVVFGAIQTFFVTDNERVVRRSFEIRYENQRLIEALERERQQAALARDRAEEANRAKSRFLAAASHDLRQPLHALSLYSAALQLRDLDGEDGEIGTNINQAVVSLSALVDSLLDISKLDAGAVQPQLQRVNLHSILRRLEGDFRPVAQSRNLRFTVSAIDVEVHTDPFLLERVVRNLVDNALKYTTAGAVAVSAVQQDTLVQVRVQDTGPGIPPGERERIFEEFYQIGNPERDRAHGLGLGLAIVRRLTQLLDLQVDLVSEVGRGSTFSVQLPCAAPRSRHAPLVAAPAPHRLNRLADAHVLVVDDEPAIRIGMRTLLESWGCRVAVAAGLTEACELLDEHGFRVDVIIADIRLRAHENGIDTVRRLHQRLGKVPALLVSGDTAPERLREAQASGLPLLHKPVSSDRLLETLAQVLAA